VHILRIQREPLDLSLADIARLGTSGALASFTGLCRDDGGSLTCLEIETYPAMAEKMLRGLMDQAQERFSLDRLCVLHRYGRLLPGERIVYVAAASPHRKPALEAVSFLIDCLKTQAPFWKKEYRGVEAKWVLPRDEDEAATRSWQSLTPAR
jgi:molybdopterin synthase catalytic subunit